MSKNMKLLPAIIAIVLVVVIGGIFLVNKQSMKLKNQSEMAQSHKSYNLDIYTDRGSIVVGKPTQMKFTIIDDKSNPVKNFELDHTKLMHFIIVRSDLQDFQHLHPTFNQNKGEFTVPVTFPESGKYRLFADFIPTGGEKDSSGNYLPVTPFVDMNIGNANNTTYKDVTPDNQTTKAQDGYEATYSIPQEIKSGEPVSIKINVSKDGQPVTNMEPYLGAQAHGILLKKDSLDFAHLHAMGESMSHMMDGKTMTMEGPLPTGPEIKFDYTFPAGGIYKLFTQFQHEGKVITLDYTLSVAENGAGSGNQNMEMMGH